MKKFVFLFVPLIAISLLTNCNSGPKQYTVTVSSEDVAKGTVSGGGTFTYNSNVTINAIPSTGYAFAGWYKDGSQVSTDASYSFIMPANDVSYEAKFKIPWYQKSDWWNYCSNNVFGEQATISDIGKEVNLTVNNLDHKVRLIDIDRDDIYDTNSKAHCTFEFTTVICNEHGPLVGCWDEEDNYDFIHSILNKFLNNDLFNSLPNDLQKFIKTVNKQVDVSEDVGSSYHLKDYQTKIFVLSKDEILTKGKMYKYYTENSGESDRIKHDLSNITRSYFLRSPIVETHNGVYYIYDDGKKKECYVSDTLASAPAFCI